MYNPGQRDGGGWGWGWRGDEERAHTHKKKKRSEIEALRAKSCREGRERENSITSVIIHTTMATVSASLCNIITSSEDNKKGKKKR